MMWIFTFLGLLLFCNVLAAPPSRLTTKQTDPIEDELIRHHHAVSGAKSTPLTRNNDAINGAGRTYESLSHDPSIQPIDEDELYDITVGDVIRDVLLTLRDNPDIVKELIASEKAKLAAQIEEYNRQMDANSENQEMIKNRLVQPQKQTNAVHEADDKLERLSQTEDDTPNTEKRADENSGVRKYKLPYQLPFLKQYGNYRTLNGKTSAPGVNSVSRATAVNGESKHEVEETVENADGQNTKVNDDDPRKM